LIIESSINSIIKSCGKCGQEIKTTIAAQKIMDKNVWFLFRDDGTELTIKIKNGLLKCNQDLTKEEINFFKDKI
jgi:hypothetical protein